MASELRNVPQLIHLPNHLPVALTMLIQQGVESMRKGLKSYEEYLTRGLINKDQLANHRSPPMSG
jgi:hypothetical protein